MRSRIPLTVELRPQPRSTLRWRLFQQLGAQLVAFLRWRDLCQPRQHVPAITVGRAQQSQQRITLAGIDIGKQGVDARPVAAQCWPKPPAIAGIGRLRQEALAQHLLFLWLQHAPSLVQVTQLDPLVRAQCTPRLPLAKW